MPKNPCASQIHHSYFRILLAWAKYQKNGRKNYSVVPHKRPTYRYTGWMLSLSGRLSHQLRFSSISNGLTDPKLTNTPFSTLAPENFEKCYKLSAITKTPSTPQTFSSTPQLPSTTLPPTMSPKYCYGYLHWSLGHGIEKSEPSGWIV